MFGMGALQLSNNIVTMREVTYYMFEEISLTNNVLILSYIQTLVYFIYEMAIALLLLLQHYCTEGERILTYTQAVLCPNPTYDVQSLVAHSIPYLSLKLLAQHQIWPSLFIWTGAKKSLETTGYPPSLQKQDQETMSTFNVLVVGIS